MHVLDATGHMTLTWDPDDPDEVARAAAEFQRLRAAGYLMFASRTDFQPSDGELRADMPRAATPAPEPVKAKRGRGRLAAAIGDATDLEQTAELKPRSRRHVAIPPMRGGAL